MLTKQERNEIIALIRQEVTPAIRLYRTHCGGVGGSTGEGAHRHSRKTDICETSANVLKNAMGVGIQHRYVGTSHSHCYGCIGEQVGVRVGSAPR